MAPRTHRNAADSTATEVNDAARTTDLKAAGPQPNLFRGVHPGATAGYATRAEPVDGGYLVTGHKIFASLAGACTYHNVLCHVEGEDRLRLLGVAHDSQGVTIERQWDAIGMRGTDSRNLVIDRAFVPVEREWLPPGVFNQCADRFPYFFMTLSFTYPGLMRAILDFTENYLEADFRRGHVIKQQGPGSDEHVLRTGAGPLLPDPRRLLHRPPAEPGCARSGVHDHHHARRTCNGVDRNPGV